MAGDERSHHIPDIASSYKGTSTYYSTQPINYQEGLDWALSRAKQAKDGFVLATGAI